MWYDDDLWCAMVGLLSAVPTATAAGVSLTVCLLLRRIDPHPTSEVSLLLRALTEVSLLGYAVLPDSIYSPRFPPS